MKYVKFYLFISLSIALASCGTSRKMRSAALQYSRLDSTYKSLQQTAAEQAYPDRYLSLEIKNHLLTL